MYFAKTKETMINVTAPPYLSDQFIKCDHYDVTLSGMNRNDHQSINRPVNQAIINE